MEIENCVALYLKVGTELFDILLCVWEVPDAESALGPAVTEDLCLNFLLPCRLMLTF
jgi:hypothetical protein